jgi:hypothetical protein
MGMKNKSFKSAYSELYLVTPAVYNKLLSCITKSETDDTEKLNGEFQTEDVVDTKISEMVPGPPEMVPDKVPTEQAAKNFEEDDDTLRIILQRIDKMEKMQEQLYANTNSNVDNGAQQQHRVEPSQQQIEPQQEQQIPAPLKLKKRQSTKRRFDNISTPEFNPEFNDNVATKQKYEKIDSVKDKSKHRCEICGKTFTRAYSKMRHKAQVHGGNQAYTATAKNISPTPTQLKNEKRGSKRRKEVFFDEKKGIKKILIMMIGVNITTNFK